MLYKTNKYDLRKGWKVYSKNLFLFGFYLTELMCLERNLAEWRTRSSEDAGSYTESSEDQPRTLGEPTDPRLSQSAKRQT